MHILLVRALLQGTSMEEAGEEKLVEAFIGIASCSREEALFFLESHNWELDGAVHSYFEEDNSTQTSPPPSPPPLSLPPPQSLPSSLPIPMAPKDKKQAKKSGNRTGIRTLADLNRSSGSGSDSDSDGPQEYYTGGEKSGMLVQDPSKGNQDVDAIFDRARLLGALEGPFDQLRPSSSRSFTGTGRLLSGETLPSAPQQPEAVVHNIIFWRNGVTVNDGPLRRLDDPENAPFFESIRKSECPKELEPVDRRSSVHVNLIRRDENYPEVEKRQVLFQGVGRTLGSEPAPSVAPAESIPVTPAHSIPSSSPVGLDVDPLLPSTSIQLRLSDGTRMVARFNHNHTVGNIRAFIDASRPGGNRGYQLQTVGFPPKQLNDPAQTIEQAGLANSVVIQKR